ncbi:MAG: hypothetical protein PHE89_07900 [Alphaproteobacteria bacterium]|nr:hypothetical protein [Alphaproteobacteria bacterium]
MKQRKFNTSLFFTLSFTFLALVYWFLNSTTLWAFAELPLPAQNCSYFTLKDLNSHFFYKESLWKEIYVFMNAKLWYVVLVPLLFLIAYSFKTFVLKEADKPKQIDVQDCVIKGSISLFLVVILILVTYNSVGSFSDKFYMVIENVNNEGPLLFFLKSSTISDYFEEQKSLFMPYAVTAKYAFFLANVFVVVGVYYVLKALKKL